MGSYTPVPQSTKSSSLDNDPNDVKVSLIRPNDNDSSDDEDAGPDSTKNIDTVV